MTKYFGSRSYFVTQQEIQRLFLAVSGGVFTMACACAVILYNWNISEAREELPPVKIESISPPVERESPPKEVFKPIVTRDIRDEIPEGYTAVTIKVDRLTSFDGWVEAGARVNVSSITKIRGQAAIVPVVNNVKIIAVERRTEGKKEGSSPSPETITLVALPEDADKIALVQSTSLISLKLLGNHPYKPTGPQKPITEGEIGRPVEPVPAAPNPEGYVTMDGKRFPIIDGRIVIKDELKDNML